MTGAILKYSIAASCVWGGVITVAVLVTLVFLIKELNKDKAFKPLSFVVIGILSVAVFYYTSKIRSAVAMKSDISAIGSLIGEIIDASGLDKSQTADYLRSSEYFQEAVSRYPVLNHFARLGDISECRLAELPSAVCQTLEKRLSNIIVKSFLWLLVFVAAGVPVVILTMGRSGCRSPHHVHSRTDTYVQRRTTGRKTTSRNSRRKKY